MRKRSTGEILAAACRGLRCCIRGLFKLSFKWKLNRDLPGPAALHACSLYENGGRLHHFVIDFLKHSGFGQVRPA